MGPNLTLTLLYGIETHLSTEVSFVLSSEKGWGPWPAAPGPRCVGRSGGWGRGQLEDALLLGAGVPGQLDDEQGPVGQGADGETMQ